jgi:hypothetical protein
MVRNGPRLISVIVTLLLWQVAVAGLAFEPATGSGTSPGAPRPHCASHLPDRLATQSTVVSGNAVSGVHHPAAPKCCDFTGAYGCCCAPCAAAVVAQVARLGRVAASIAAISDVPGPPSLLRSAQVFRPPI